MTLFGSWLSETVKLQRAFGDDSNPKNVTILGESIRMNITAIIAELGEMLAETTLWKTWIQIPPEKQVFNRDFMANELVDAMHFIANICVALNITDEELNRLYSAKMEKNRARQLSGTYDGVKDANGRETD